MHVKFLETLDWSILIAYFLILIAIGIWASSKRLVLYRLALRMEIQ